MPEIGQETLESKQSKVRGPKILYGLLVAIVQEHEAFPKTQPILLPKIGKNIEPLIEDHHKKTE